MEAGCVEIQIPAIGGCTPLVLLHDGGGTLFNYFLLGRLGRPVYGIANQHFDTGEPWVNGLHGMAKEYTSFIEETIAEGEILLGGWSMGGTLSLEIAHILRNHPKMKVKGIIMMDTPYSKNPIPEGKSVGASDPEFGPTTKQEIRDKTLRSMNECRRLMTDWGPPTFESGRPPPAIMLRASDRTTPPGDSNLSHVDLARDDPYLGWKRYQHPDFFHETHNVQGAHFSMFRLQYMDGITAKLKAACDTLDK